ncbi:hypothetical protein BI364_09060 [Acidihalobacter yilgarnensis]|uniref:DUF423 domain-containing protein n=1 Tax=Acidihalobacter yilgarnensis TaxID=2819280 RepID=A0A1D8INP0_9GAMM|nr:DUF423 domain-containing protein [Acidihalobacter yilgarnensis]AOU98090.1 hypothetical protein BI364_09060 [Acidihalobacter yilgarnensis]
MNRSFVALGAALGMIYVIMGAVSDHVVHAEVDAHLFRIFNIALRFEIGHALGLILIGLTAAHLGRSRLLTIAGWLMFAGTLMFSGSLYLIVLTGHPGLGIITPFGGSALILSWLLFTLAVIKGPAKA